MQTVGLHVQMREMHFRALSEDNLGSWFEQLHDKALKETNVARSQEHFDPNLQVCAKFGKIFVEAENIIKSSALLREPIQKIGQP